MKAVILAAALALASLAGLAQAQSTCQTVCTPTGQGQFSCKTVC